MPYEVPPGGPSRGPPGGPCGGVAASTPSWGLAAARDANVSVVITHADVFRLPRDCHSTAARLPHDCRTTAARLPLCFVGISVFGKRPIIPPIEWFPAARDCKENAVNYSGSRAAVVRQSCGSSAAVVRQY